MKQRDNHWRQARLGCVTASRFGDLITDPSVKGVFSVEGERGAWHVVQEGQTITGDFTKQSDAKEDAAEKMAEWRKTHWSATAESYLDEKLAEMIHGQPADVWRSDPTDWGTANEPYAFEAAIPVIQERFGEQLELPVDDYTFMEHATELNVGCSPDGIIGADGLLEIKCPFNGAKWIRAKRKGLVVPADNVAQVQGQLWVTGRQWTAFCYFDPRVTASGLDPLLLLRVERDNDYIDNILAPRVIAFRDYLQAEYQALKGEGEPF